MRTPDEIDAAATEGSPFSNGSEGYAWMDRWCDECANNDEETEKWCPILSVALLGKTPAEWSEKPWQQIKGAPEGEVAPVLGDTYHCSEFVQAPEADPDVEFARRIETVNIPVLDGQMDLFGDLL